MQLLELVWVLSLEQSFTAGFGADLIAFVFELQNCRPFAVASAFLHCQVGSLCDRLQLQQVP